MRVVPLAADLRSIPEVGSRTLVLAPHPDDDTLAAAGLLQWVIAGVGKARVVYLTAGENNPWAQRVVERRWRIGPGDRSRWGERRRREAMESLARLGLDPGCATFLNLPDQHLTTALMSAPDSIVTALEREIRRWRPTLLLVPSLRDQHPDHGVAAIAVRAALARIRRQHVPVALSYVIHGPAWRTRRAWFLTLGEQQQRMKRSALMAHVSQLAWHRRAFLAADLSSERFTDERVLGGIDAVGPGSGSLRIEEGGWSFELKQGLRDRLERPRLLAVGRVHGRIVTIGTSFPAHGGRVRTTTSLQSDVGALRLERDGTALRANFTARPGTVHAEWFVKLESPLRRRLELMDRWPWFGVATPQEVSARTSVATAASQPEEVLVAGLESPTLLAGQGRPSHVELWQPAEP